MKGLLKAVQDVITQGLPLTEENLKKYGASPQSRSFVLLCRTGENEFEWPYKYNLDEVNKSDNILQAVENRVPVGRKHVFPISVPVTNAHGIESKRVSITA